MDELFGGGDEGRVGRCFRRRTFQLYSGALFVLHHCQDWHPAFF
jgi:hypothetical protein